MTNTNKRRGSAWEAEIVRFLSGWHWPHAERRLAGSRVDRGDIAGIPGVVIEAKNQREFRLADWMNEANVEAANARARVGVVWAKRRGKASAGDGYVIMSGQQFAELLREAGY